MDWAQSDAPLGESPAPRTLNLDMGIRMEEGNASRIIGVGGLEYGGFY